MNATCNLRVCKNRIILSVIRYFAVQGEQENKEIIEIQTSGIKYLLSTFTGIFANIFVISEAG